MSQRIRVGPASAIDRQTIQYVWLPRSNSPPKPAAPPRQALVLRDERGQLRAYLNLCQHLPVPLDSFQGRVSRDPQGNLLCGTHGAAFRPGDGLCVRGPCQGESLRPLEIEEADDGTVWLVVV